MGTRFEFDDIPTPFTCQDNSQALAVHTWIHVLCSLR
jgi:hypothetical protein